MYNLRWAAIGLNINGEMEGSDAMVVWKSGSSLIVSDRHQPTVGVSNADSSQDLTLVQSESQIFPNGTFVVVFTRPLNTGDSNDRPITSETAQSWLFAYSNSGAPGASSSASIGKHSYTDAKNIAFLQDSGTIQGEGKEDSAKLDAFTQVHGSLMFVAWNVLIPAAIYIARFEKNSLGHWWFILHSNLMRLAAVFMIIAFGFIVAALDEHFDNAHAILGLITLLLTILIQMPLGFFIDRWFVRGRTEVPWHDKVHWWLGRAVFLLSYVLIPLGLWSYGASDAIKIAWFVYAFVVILVVFIVGQIIHRNDTPHDIVLKQQEEKSEVQETA